MGWLSGKQQASLDMLAERQRRTEEEMVAIAKIVGEIHTALVVRDPGTRLSAEAYDGLRKTVIAGATQRRAHLVQLVELSTALNRGADSHQLTSMVDEWLIQAGLTQVVDARHPELFEVLGGAGEGLKVLAPAWVDSQNGALIKRGTAERVPLPPRAVPRAASPPAGPAVSVPPSTEPPALGAQHHQVAEVSTRQPDGPLEQASSSGVDEVDDKSSTGPEPCGPDDASAIEGQPRAGGAQRPSESPPDASESAPVAVPQREPAAPTDPGDVPEPGTTHRSES